MLHTVLLVVAAVCFALDALDIDFTNGRLHYIGLGLLAWVLTALI